MAVYFKFKSAKDFDSVSFEGHFISVGNLKDKIVEQKKLGRGSDFNLVISNAQTDEEYTDEGYLVPKNTSVIVRRVPGRPSMPIIADVKDERKSAVEVQPVTKGLENLGSTEKTTTSASPLPDGLDDFGFDLYAVPEIVQVRNTSLTEDEDSKIRAFVDQSATDWQRQTQDSFAGGKGYGNKGQGRGLPLRGAYGRGFEKKTPPHGYVCHRCGISGHYIQHCPTNGDPQYDQKKVKPPTGIPKTMLVANPDGSYALPTGEVAVLRPNEAVFDREVDGLPSSSRPALDVPLEFTCPLCKRVLKDAVLTSKCCFKSYCDECIRSEIITKGQCVCGAKNVLADDLLPNRTLRDAIDKIMEAQPSGATSSGQVGSRAQLPDMESARFAQPKVPSPGASVSLKEATVVESDGSDTTKPFALNKSETTSEPAVPKRESGGDTTRVQKEAGPVIPEKNGAEVDASPESQLTKESVQEAVNSERLRKSDAEAKDEAPTFLEPSKGKKRPKGKRARQVDMPHPDGMWNQGRNYNHYGDPHMQPENGCMHCGAFDHPSGNCPMLNGPGPSHPSMPMHGPMFGPGFNPHMRGMMHPPMGDGYMMPYQPGPYPGYGVPPYELPFNRPMMPPQEAFIPPGLMPYGPPPPMQREYFDGPPMSRDEFEARKAEFKRRREREQRFGREQVKYPGGEYDMEPPTRSHGKTGPRMPPNASERQRDVSPDVPLDNGEQIRSHRNGERRHATGSKPSRVKESRTEHGEVQPGFDADEYERERDHRMGDEAHERAHERWGSHRAADEASSGDADREARYPSRGDAYSMGGGQYEKGSKAAGDSRSSRHRRSASGYGSMDDADDSNRRRQAGGSHVGPSSSPPLRNVRRRIASSDDRRPVTRDEEEDISTADAGSKATSRRSVGEKSGSGAGKIINLKERPRGSVFERTNLPVKPRRSAVAPDEEYDVIDEREFSRLKRAKGAGNRASGR